MKASSTWEIRSLGECADFTSGGTPSKRNPDYWGGCIPWVSPKDMKVPRIYDSEDHITELGAENGTRLVDPETILIVVRGMILAQEFPVAITKRRVAFNQDMKALTPKAGVDNNFLYYWLKANAYEIRGIADEAAHGTKRLQTDRLLELTVDLPPLETQRQIADILSAYDDLIENNTRRIQILEEMARTIYREWFVHFRYPGHASTPLVDSPIGPVPDGWEIRKLESFGEVVTGKTPSKKDPENFGDYMPFIKIPDMRDNMWILETEDNLSEKGAETQRTKTLPPGTICASCIGTIGLVSIVARPSQTNQQINSIVLDENHNREFLYFAVSELGETMALHGATGATMGNLSKGKFSALEVAYPSAALVQKFSILAAPMLSQIRALMSKNSNLQKVRDLLLPRLISGSIDIQTGSQIDHPERAMMTQSD